jgi:PIN domain nuclease of toxin-antitoxin system
MLVEKGRISVDREPMEWMQQALEDDRVSVLPLTPAIAVTSHGLAGLLHGDPADRLIVATAIVESAPLVTRDGLLAKFEALRTIW